MRKNTALTAAAALSSLLLIPVSSFSVEVRFPDSHDPAPAGWTGPVFRLSQDYPTTLPNEQKPWKAFSFETQPAEYVDAVYKYVREGNQEVEWVVQDNKVRRWYHAPWMHYGDSGREFVHGLTRERTTPRPTPALPAELHPNQTSCFQNWAVSFFNAPGGYQLGRIWADPWAPDATQALFPEGTVAAKLLFTSADETQVPYLKNALEWQANVSDLPAQDLNCRERLRRKVQTVRLLQIDLAVRDDRANPTAGWVFATLSYDGDRAGATPFDRMVPVGLMWGNDPLRTPADQAAGKKIADNWINPDSRTPQHLGFLGRLNGPVDNPRSSCLSCHATAQTPARSPMIWPENRPDQAPRWFRNINAGESFDARSISTDYSLQVAVGIQNLRASRQTMGGSFAAARPPAAAPTGSGFVVLNAPVVINNDVVLAPMDNEFEAVKINGTIEFRIRRGQ
jgi:hypothetical protein